MKVDQTRLVPFPHILFSSYYVSDVFDSVRVVDHAANFIDLLDLTELYVFIAGRIIFIEIGLSLKIEPKLIDFILHCIKQKGILRICWHILVLFVRL